MYDAMIAMTDIVTNFWSLGMQPEPGRRLPGIITGFEAADGWFIMQVSREHQFARLAATVGHPEWVDDPRFATRQGWADHLEDVVRPAVEAWAGTKTKLDVCHELAGAGLAVAPCNSPEEVVADPHVAAHHMLVEVPRVDGVEQPYLVPGNPVKLSNVAEGPETRVPWLGEHTEDVLVAELGLGEDELAELRAGGVIS
jgi:formyl-CoA transferase